MWLKSLAKIKSKGDFLIFYFSRTALQHFYTLQFTLYYNSVPGESCNISNYCLL